MWTSTKGKHRAVTGPAGNCGQPLRVSFPLALGTRCGEALDVPPSQCPGHGAPTQLSPPLVSRQGKLGAESPTTPAASVRQQHVGSRWDAGVEPRSASVGEVERGESRAKGNSCLGELSVCCPARRQTRGRWAPSFPSPSTALRPARCLCRAGTSASLSKIKAGLCHTCLHRLIQHR